MPNFTGSYSAGIFPPPIVSGLPLALTIVGGNVNPLIHGGQQQLAVVDQNSNPITPDSWTSGTTANVTVSSTGLLQGIGESGTSLITAIKSGYTSGTMTTTCSGGLYSLDPNTLAQTNGQSVTSITDSGSVAWTNVVTPPTCYQDATSGRRALLFNGTTQFLQGASHISAFEGASLSLFTAIAPLTQGVQQYLLAESILGTTGWFHQLFSDNKYYVDVATGFTGTGAGTAISTASFSRVGFTIAASAQTSYVNGASTSTTAFTYTTGTQTMGPFLGTATASAGFYGGYQGLLLTYNRVITSAEIAQVDLRLVNEIAALNA